MCASIRFFTSTNSPFRSLTSIAPSFCLDGCADGLAHDDAAKVARRAEIEHDDWQLVVHAQGNGRSVHDLETLLEDLQIGDFVEPRGGGVQHGIGGIDA